MRSFLSGHKLVPGVLNVKKPPTEIKTLSVCKLKHITTESFKAAFNEDAIDFTSPFDTVLHQFNDELHKSLDATAPLKEIQVPAHQRQPWFNEDVKARHKVVQFNQHCDEHQLLPDFQSAYRQGYSTKMSLIKMMNDVLGVWRERK